MVLVVTEAVIGLLPLHVGSGDMSSFEQGFVCPAGPTIEWLEPKLPDVLKNGGTLASITKDSSKMQGTAVEPAEMDSCDLVGVMIALHPIPFLTFCLLFISATDVFWIQQILSVATLVFLFVLNCMSFIVVQFGLRSRVGLNLQLLSQSSYLQLLLE